MRNSPQQTFEYDVYSAGRREVFRIKTTTSNVQGSKSYSLIGTYTISDSTIQDMPAVLVRSDQIKDHSVQISISKVVVKSRMLLLLSRLSGCLFSWLEEQSDSRAAIDAKRAQWRRELGKHTRIHFKT